MDLLHIELLEATAAEIMRVDGAGDKETRSSLSCEQTRSIAKFLGDLARAARIEKALRDHA